MWFAVVQARAHPLASLMVDHTVLTQTTILVLTRTRVATVSHKSWKQQTNHFLTETLKEITNTTQEPQTQSNDKITGHTNMFQYGSSIPVNHLPVCNMTHEMLLSGTAG